MAGEPATEIRSPNGPAVQQTEVIPSKLSGYRKRLPDWILALALLCSFVLWQRGTFPASTGDLFPLQFAAYEWHVGTPERMYATYERPDWDEWLREWKTVVTRLNGDVVANAYVYPPFVSALLAPFADVPAAWWRNAVLVVNLLAVIILVLQTLRLCNVPLRTRPFLWALALALICNPVSSGVRFGQIGVVLAALTWFGLLSLRDNRPWIGGSAIGLAAAVKLSPLALLAYPALRKRWKPCVAGGLVIFGIFAVSILILGLPIHRLWWTIVRYADHHVWANPIDQSLTAWMARVVLGYSVDAMHFHATPSIQLFRLTCELLFSGTTMALLWLRRRDLDRQFPAAAGFLFSGILLSLPFLWNYYLIYLLPVLGWTLYHSYQQERWGFWDLWLAVATFFFCMRLYHFYGDSPLGSLFSGSHTIGLLLLWGWLARYLWRAPTVIAD
jgi:hypothetical protein